MWIVFTPNKLTPVIRSQADNFIPYPSEFGEVELTFYKTFPDFGIKIKEIAVISKMDENVNDTLLKVNELIAEIDLKALWKKNELIIQKFSLNDGMLNIFSDSLGRSNYDLFLNGKDDIPEDTATSEMSFINLKKVEFKNMDLSYTDIATKLSTTIKGIGAVISGEYDKGHFNGLLNVSNAIVSFNNESENYLDASEIRLKIPLDVNIPAQLIKLKDAFVSVDGSGFTVNGSLENDSAKNRIITDIHFATETWQLKDIMKLIPPEFLKEYPSFDVSGAMLSEGTFHGIISDTLMPLINIKLAISDLRLEYDALPFPLREVNGIVHLYADLNNKSESNILIDSLEAKTPSSFFRTAGNIKNLFSDIFLDLVTEADIATEEFRPFIPEDMNLNINGRIKGKVLTKFTLSQANDLALEKMKMSGSALLSDFELRNDSISLSTSKSEIDFSFPNPYRFGKNTSFACIGINSDDLTASKAGDFLMFMKNSNLYVEISDIRDTGIISDICCTFSIDSVFAAMDTINVNINKPMGYFNISPVNSRPLEPEIKLGYNSYKLEAGIGENRAFVDNITFHANISNDQSQKDIFLKWPASGQLDLDKGEIYISSLIDTVKIPKLNMEFEPENFNIHKSCFSVGKSDFDLSGSLNNILSYFRGDSILRGDFSFISNNIDLVKIMALTSGIGPEEELINETEADPTNNSGSVSGPYIVPNGIDVSLKTKIKNASLGNDTIINILGDVRVNDGILLLDGLKFTTPAADMQLTAMYRTPRKNHLYLGIDYHMFDVEISRLLNMIPDIDTLMPMLRSFEGSGEFHLAAETYLDSLYNVKKSTLRGASSIKGTDLVLMDGETFSEIAKSLRFSKKAKNRVDSLSAEFTVFREEIDVFPFLIVMDRYKAVVAGRHNFDMSFDYHVSLVDSPLPVRLGIDISGNEDKLKYRLVSPKYPEFYRPVSRRAVDNQQLELRKIIREALLSNVKK